MSNRGQASGVLQPPAPPVQQPPPKWSVDAETGLVTVAQPPRAPSPANRQPAGSARTADAPSTSAQQRPPGPLQRVPGGLALDAIEQLGADDFARSNWRDLVSRCAGSGKGAVRETAVRGQINTAVGGAFPIAVLNLKGGVGKTAVVEALGSTFASMRDDRVIAVDLDAGDLADRHGRRNPLTLADLLLDRRIARYADVRAHTYMNSAGLEVLGPPDYAETHWSPTRQDFVKAFSILRNHYSVVLVDCPKALKAEVMGAVLAESRALVVVTSTSLDAIHKTSTTLDWLTNNGHRRLAESTVLAVNNIERAKPEPLAAKQLEQLSDRVGATVALPFDRHIRQGTEIGLDRMSKDSRRAYLQMAAALAQMFPGRLGATHSGGSVSHH